MKFLDKLFPDKKTKGIKEFFVRAYLFFDKENKPLTDKQWTDYLNKVADHPDWDFNKLPPLNTFFPKAYLYDGHFH